MNGALLLFPFFFCFYKDSLLQQLLTTFCNEPGILVGG